MSSVEVLTEQVGTPAGRRTAGMAGLGCALPEGAVPTGDIAARVGVEPEWIIRRTGIASRRRLAPGATIADLAERAARAALDDAGVDGADLDAVLVATASADHVMPAAAPLVASRLGATAAMAWDVNLACTGFLAALEQAAALIESGRAEHVLVIAAEALSRVTDHTDRKTAALFGDGAGAAVLSPGGRMRLGHSVLRAQGDDVGALVVAHEDRLVRMDGQVVFQRAVAAMERCCRDVLAAAGLEPGDVDLVVPHQANARITVTLADRLGVPAERVVDAIAHVGNTGAASIPLALDEARRDGRLPDRGLLLLTAFGAGFASGAVLVEIGEAG
ncbi:MAG: 3-oxoacyl-[acyl-carrier-protein] synthase [Baekduia sp.]|jgi:3-oxoacyl-[acyl-carrier-protein] synthase-3|nr:3-oxoacyl-[acyl-carrier-protein] synthase [Baekduia sp.]